MEHTKEHDEREMNTMVQAILDYFMSLSQDERTRYFEKLQRELKQRDS